MPRKCFYLLMILLSLETKAPSFSAPIWVLAPPPLQYALESALSTWPFVTLPSLFPHHVASFILYFSWALRFGQEDWILQTRLLTTISCLLYMATDQFKTLKTECNPVQEVVHPITLFIMLGNVYVIFLYTKRNER